MELKLGIALGSGAARGWSHIGLLEALAKRGLHPTVVAGASVGSLVGAAFAGGQLDLLRDWVLTLRRMDIFRMMDARMRGGGIMTGNRLMDVIADQLGDQDIEQLALKFGAVATDLASGREIWLRDGPLIDAVRASSGMPGLFAPVRYRDSWMIDGGLVNPVPVSLCRALGADIVIAVNLNAQLVSRRLRREREVLPLDVMDEEASQFERMAERVSGWFAPARRSGTDAPGILDVVGTSINIMQDRITRSRMVGEPPELIITPHLDDFQLMDFHRAKDAIRAGHDAVDRVGDSLDVIAKQLSATP